MLISYVSSQLVPSQKQSRIKDGPEDPRPHLENEVLKPTRGPPHHVTKCHQSLVTAHRIREMRRHEHLNPCEANPNSPRNNGSEQP